MPIEALRTGDARFADLPDWPYQPRYLDAPPGHEDLRMHYIDEGPPNAPVVLCLHGEPTWGFLYRRMIPVFLEAGLRVVAPDFYGFGRSDKPVDDDVYTWEFHRNSLVRFVEALALTDLYLVVQDWGGLLGLTLPLEFADQVTGLLIMNTGFGTGSPPSDGFIEWRDFMARTPDLAVGRLMGRSVPHLTAEELAGYDAPFPGPEYKAGVRRFPAIVPTEPEMGGVEVSRRAVRWWSEEFAGSSLMAIGMKDPVLGPAVMNRIHPLIRGCPEPMKVEDAGHFVQEWGEPVAGRALTQWGF
jgi:pimeloyl-ACP methyl ester carboxylesterase